jgi:beta-galactosidase
VATAPPPVNDGQWHHVALVYDCHEGVMTLYLDGAFRASAAGALEPVQRGSYLTLGAVTSLDPDQAFDGRLDDLRLYDLPLPASDILSLAKAP